MKTLKNFGLMFILLLSFATIAQAQTTANLPETGSILKLENEELNVQAGKSATLNFQIIRSKFYQKRQYPIDLTINAPKGITATFSPSPNTGDNGTIEVKVDALVAAGKYNLTIQKTPRSQYEVRGAFLTLIVKSNGEVEAVKE